MKVIIDRDNWTMYLVADGWLVVAKQEYNRYTGVDRSYGDIANDVIQWLAKLNLITDAEVGLNVILKEATEERIVYNVQRVALPNLIMRFGESLVTKLG